MISGFSRFPEVFAPEKQAFRGMIRLRVNKREKTQCLGGFQVFERTLTGSNCHIKVTTAFVLCQPRPISVEFASKKPVIAGLKTGRVA